MGNGNDSRERLFDELTRALKRIMVLEDSLERANEALRGKEESLRTQSQLSSDIFFSYDNTLKVLDVSENVERITGYRKEELVGKYFHDLQLMVHPEDVDEAFENAQHVLSGKTVYPNIYRFFTKDGKRKFAEVNGVPILRDGKVVAMISRASDITEHIERERSLRRDEENWRTVLQALPQAVCIRQEHDSRYVYVNEGFSALTGFSPEEVVGRTVADIDLLLDDDVLFPEQCRDSRDPAKRVIRFMGKGGTMIEVLAICRPLRFNGQDCTLMVMTDMTPFRDMEEERDSACRENAEQEKMEALRILAGGFAHDFNNMLTTILGYARMALRDVSDLADRDTDLTTVRSDLDEVRRSAQRARDLVNQILAYTRHGRRKSTTLVLGDAVRGSLQMLRPLVPPNVVLRENLDGERQILGDPVQIHQVVMNLCANALAAMRERGGTLEVSLERSILPRDNPSVDPGLAPGAYLRLTVSDTGHGMDPCVRERIYEPYYTTARRSGSKGLGLSVVHGIVHDHGGGIACSSVAGKGTTFEVYLPEVVPIQDQMGPQDEPDDARGNERILIIDDEPALVDRARRTLQELGYTVVSKTRGSEALEDFRRDPGQYDLVITDTSMPDMEGDSLSGRLSEIRRDIPVILFDTFERRMSPEEACRFQNRVHMRKPFEMQGLVKTVRKVLDRERNLSDED
jgi:PAS domain S-box-containing protein